MMESEPTVLVVDDEANIRLLLEAELEDAGFEVHTASSVQNAMDLLSSIAVDIVLTDMKMPGQGGLDLCGWVQSKQLCTDVILMTGYSSSESAAEALRRGAADYLFKPFEPLSLVVDSVRRVADRRSLAQRERRLRNRVGHLERFAAAGRMTAAVAHELNNPAEIVVGNLLLIAEEVERLQKRREDLSPELKGLAAMVQEAQRGVSRLKDLALDFGALASISDQDSRSFDLHQVVSLTLRILSIEARHNVGLVADLQPVGDVVGNPGVQSQLLMTLVHDALQRLPEVHSGAHTIHVSLSKSEDSALIRVRDNGLPAGEEVREALSDSVRRWLDSPGVSCRWSLGANENLVEIKQPLVVKAVSAAKSTSQSLSQSPDHRQRALVVDDEAPIRRVLRMMLRRSHDVDEACGGLEAMERLEQDSDYDIILCDLMMPDLDGTRVYAQTAERWPHLGKRFLFVTGGAVTDQTRRFLEDNEWRVLKKPFSRSELQEAMGSVLQAR